MTEFHNSVIALELSSPLFVRSNPYVRLLLESIMAGIFHDQTRDGEASVARANQMFDHWEVNGRRIPKASQVVIGSPVYIETESIFRGPLREFEEIPALRHAVSQKSNSPGSKPVNWSHSPATLIRPFKSAMSNTYLKIVATELFFFFCGDTERVEAAFRRAGRIGALRAKGGGRLNVDKVRADVVPSQSAHFGVLVGNRLMRPLPRDLRPVIGNAACLESSVENWQMPFHDEATKEACIVPQQIGTCMTMSRDQIADLLS